MELGKAISLLLSIVSLWALMASAFFVPGTRWDERIAMALFLHLAIAACICFASGMVFRADEPIAPRHTLMRTLPVQLFFWSLAGLIVLFLLSWYLSVYYVPMLWKNQPH
ncbi:hypothetical protein [Silvibacterium acidisoli]|uniref:hypothetical protein n=1 Tax=Acidobacteriaceae bacterium ZG23-2 TaxID=2883246 RepID=UPI00406C75B0